MLLAASSPREPRMRGDKKKKERLNGVNTAVCYILKGQEAIFSIVRYRVVKIYIYIHIYFSGLAIRKVDIPP